MFEFFDLLFWVAVLLVTLYVIFSGPPLQAFDRICFLLLWFVDLVLAVLAWIIFALTFWRIPRDPNHRSLETNAFLWQHLWFGHTLYSHNLSWRRDLSKHRADVRNGSEPVARFRFSWRRWLRVVLG